MQMRMGSSLGSLSRGDPWAESGNEEEKVSCQRQEWGFSKKKKWVGGQHGWSQRCDRAWLTYRIIAQHYASEGHLWKKEKRRTFSGRMWCAKPRILDMLLKTAGSHLVTLSKRKMWWDKCFKNKPSGCSVEDTLKREPTWKREMGCYCNNPGKKF